MHGSLASIVHRRAGIPAVLLAALTGCVHDPGPSAALPNTPVAFSSAASGAATADIPARGEWWRAFRDPALDDLIARADGQNFTIRQAEARLA